MPLWDWAGIRGDVSVGRLAALFTRYCKVRFARLTPVDIQVPNRPAGKLLAAAYGGDPASTDWRHLGRLAGFTNQKPARRTSGGHAPLGQARQRANRRGAASRSPAARGARHGVAASSAHLPHHRGVPECPKCVAAADAAVVVVRAICQNASRDAAAEVLDRACLPSATTLMLPDYSAPRGFPAS